MSEHPAIRVGEDYPVLEVFAERTRALFRLPDRVESREPIDTPGMWDAAMFEIVSERMPTCWVAGLDEGRLTPAAQEWQRPVVWKEYFDHLSAAVAEYDRLKAQKIIAEGDRLAE
ncbi:hypothetical protein [Frankia sp. QA3]|uniref:hypothetical protein n=1 Tax=Frankia sp. QA3 TaxID=710111 RepID=UPI0002F243EE|nr:hypothetical protein [Frankia sp. QA3]